MASVSNCFTTSCCFLASAFALRRSFIDTFFCIASSAFVFIFAPFGIFMPIDFAIVLNISPIPPPPPSPIILANPPNPPAPPPSPNILANPPAPPPSPNISPKPCILDIISVASVTKSSLLISPDSILFVSLSFTVLTILPIFSGFFIKLDNTSAVEFMFSKSEPNVFAKSPLMSSANSLANFPILPSNINCSCSRISSISGNLRFGFLSFSSPSSLSPSFSSPSSPSSLSPSSPFSNSSKNLDILVIVLSNCP